jgi:protein-disulfide isomerase
MEFLGSEDWASLAGAAGVPDLTAFGACIALPLAEFDRILAGRALGKRLGVSGTPTLWVNGRLFRGRTLRDFLEEAKRLGD